MDNVLDGCEGYSAAYLDGILIYSSTWEEHLSHLREIFSRIEKAKLTLAPDKAQLVSGTIKFLGYEFMGGTIGPDQLKIKAILDLPRPETKTDVRSFLGMTGYYRGHIPKYSEIAAPLTDLTKDSCPNRVIWSETCETAFVELKAALTKGPLLRAPVWGKPFVLITDGSSVGLAAVLMQEGEDGSLYPILYISRKLIERERKLSATEIELLAIVFAFTRLEYYLRGHTTTLYTDHNPLTTLKTMKSKNSKITRWMLFLQEFDFIVKHISGKNNCITDHLSRY
jgi:hypothetical protein